MSRISGSSGRTTVYPVVGDWAGPVGGAVVQSTTDGWANTLYYNAFIPAGARPTVPAPLIIFVDGATHRAPLNNVAANSGFWTSDTLGSTISANKASFSALNNPAGVAAWSGATAYVVGVLASLGGSTYCCTAPNTNQSPPNTAFWVLIVAPIICLSQASGGPDPLGLRYGRNFHWWVIRDACARYTIDRNRIHMIGYSHGAFQTWAMAFRFPLLFASLGIWDSPVVASLLAQHDNAGDDLNSDLLPSTTYATPTTNVDDDDAASRWNFKCGNIAMNYQHGALDTLSFPLFTHFPTGSGHPNAQEQLDFGARNYDIVTDPCTFDAGTLRKPWSTNMGLSGQTQMTTVAATTAPSPGYATSNRRINVPYSSYDHNGIASGGNTFLINNPFWKWVAARVRSEY